MVLRANHAALCLATSALASCSLLFSTNPAEVVEDATPISVDGPTQDQDAGNCADLVGFEPINVGYACASGQDDIVLAGTNVVYTLDTSSKTLTKGGTLIQEVIGTLVTQQGGSEVLVVAVDTLEIQVGVTFEIVGEFPLVVIANQIDISGSLFAVGTGAASGAGGDVENCDPSSRGFDGVKQTGTQKVNFSAGSGGGGAGGSTVGAEGAPVEGIALAPSTKAGESIAQGEPPVPLHGGCAGGKGGELEENGSGGLGGGAGGAIQLVANYISYSGLISVSGGGGGGYIGNSPIPSHAGGGGGGSGGGILLQTSTFGNRTGTLTYNGGGGGEGSRSHTTLSTVDGADGSRVNNDSAVGGTDTTSKFHHGGDGGNGGTPGSPGSPPTNGAKGTSSKDSGAAGGGGGGGAAGVCRIIIVDEVGEFTDVSCSSD